MLKYRNHLGQPETRQAYLEQFAAHGIEETRLWLVSGFDDNHTHLAHYHKVDIALDPFPFTGATTTFQALWMGVQVITLLGRTISRMAGDIVVHAGLAELAAQNRTEYVEIARKLATDRPRLRQLRAGLRQRLLDSPLCDADGYARSVEQGYRTMWQEKMGDG